MNKSVSDTNRKIAEKLGYSVYHYDKDHPAQCYYQLWDAEGEPVIFTREGQRKTEAEAWADCPDFEGDIRYAAELLGNRAYEIKRPVGGFLITVTIAPNGKGEAMELPAAIANAFLSLDLEQERKRKRYNELVAERQRIDAELRDLGEKLE